MAVNRKQRRAQARQIEKAAVAEAPQSPELSALLAQAGGLGAERRFDEAQALLDKALAGEPGNIPALRMSGLLAFRAGDAERACARFSALLERKPDDAAAANNLGLALRGLERPDEALAAFRQAIAAKPDHAKAHQNMALILIARGEDAAGEAALRKALAIDPAYSGASCHLARLLRRQLRNREAAKVLQEAFKADPESNTVLAELGTTLDIMRLLERSEQAWRRLASREPDVMAWHRALGHALAGQGRMAEAGASFERCLELDPAAADVIAGLGDLRKGQGRLEEAESLVRRALAVRSDMIGAHSNLLVILNYTARDNDVLFAEHRAWAKRFTDDAAPLTERVPLDHGGPRLRIGYVSPDFRQHSAAYFIEPLMQAHDRSAFEIHCYSGVQREDEFTERCRAMSDGWTSTLELSARALARRIADDGIDILVDLCGHFGGHRLDAFALRPAPVQVTWMGYPATTGMAQMDWRMVDPVTDPEGDAERWHSERLMRLKGGFLCYRPHQDAPDVAPSPCLRARHVTFGSFNNLAKIVPEVVACWSRLLDRVPGSRLLLKDRGFADEATRRDWMARFAGHGIGDDRLELCARVENLQGHLDFYRRVDIALDPFPYNGTTTTCEAMWMGVPVVSLAGNRHAARVGASLLEMVGLGGHVAEDEEGYIAIAQRLAGDAQALDVLRRGMRRRVAASRLCDNADFARRIEEAYRTMAREAGAPLAP